MIPITPSTIMIGVIGVLTLTNAVTYNLWRSCQNEHDLYVAKVDAANAKVAADNATLVAKLTQQAADIQTRYERDLGTIRSDYVSRLRTANRRCAALPGATATARLVNETTADTGLGATGQASEFEQACVKLETDSAVTTLQLLHLQDWAGRQRWSN